MAVKDLINYEGREHYGLKIIALKSEAEDLAVIHFKIIEYGLNIFSLNNDILIIKIGEENNKFILCDNLLIKPL